MPRERALAGRWLLFGRARIRSRAPPCARVGTSPRGPASTSGTPQYPERTCGHPDSIGRTPGIGTNRNRRKEQPAAEPITHVMLALAQKSGISPLRGGYLRLRECNITAVIRSAVSGRCAADISPLRGGPTYEGHSSALPPQPPGGGGRTARYLADKPFTPLTPPTHQARSHPTHHLTRQPTSPAPIPRILPD